MAANGMTPNEWFERVKGLMREQAGRCAEQAHQWAVENHPWDNVTGQAEKGLTGYMTDTEDKVGFGVGHKAPPEGVTYGKYLETAHDGKYAVCQRAVDHFIPEFDAQLKNALNKMPRK
jgi:hypothetical protein